MTSGGDTSHIFTIHDNYDSAGDSASHAQIHEKEIMPTTELKWIISLSFLWRKKIIDNKVTHSIKNFIHGLLESFMFFKTVVKHIENTGSSNSLGPVDFWYF